MTTVKELGPSMGKVEITLDISGKQEAREFNKFGKSGKVCNCTGKDSTGEVKVTLWNEQVEQVNDGSKIKISNGWVSEYQGELQLSTGKFGKLEILDGASSPKAPEKKPTKGESVSDAEEEDIY